MTSEDVRYVLTGRIVTMDAADRVLDAGAVCIRGRRIVAVQPASQPLPIEFAHAPHIDTHGTIYPGLIELHNHLSYNILPIWQVPKKFQDRRDWRSRADRLRATSAPMKAIAQTHREYVPTIVRYVECKCLMSGTTTSQGMSLFFDNQISQRYKGLVRNVEENTGQAELPFARSHVDMGDPAEMAERIRGSSCVLLHLAEGLGDPARAEFLSLRQPDGSWAITSALGAIHCTGLADEHFATLGQFGGAMIWSPMSNFMLYGATANVASAKQHGVPIALGADWSPTGSKNLLGEMKVAWLHSEYLGGLFSPQAIVAMATTTPAAILKWHGQLGSLEPGKLADVLVVRRANGADDSDPYLQLIHTSEADIVLIVIDGVPRYGLQTLLADALHTRMSTQDAMRAIEPWDVGGRVRGLYLQQADAHPAVAQFSLKMAADYLREAMNLLPNPPGFPPPSLGVDATGLTLELDNNEDPDAFEPDSLDIESTTPGPMPLDELTVAEKPGVYFAHIMAQPNVPAYVKTALPRLYQEKTMPHNFEPYMKIGEPLRQHLEQLSVCRDAACPVPNSHPFYPTPDAPPFYFGKQPCMPVVPTRLKMGGVMVLGIYPNCRRATVATADGNRQMWVPIEDADEPFEYSRYFDSYGVRDLRAGTILQRAYWAQLGLDRERDMYITNIVKCFLFEPDDVQTVHTLGWTSPPVSATRARYFEAAQVCVRLHLAKEIELCQPKLVIAVGGEGCRVIHDRLNPADTSAGKIFSQLRGKLLRAGVDEGPNDSRSPLFRSVNVLHLYHPSGLSLGNLNRHLTDMRHGREALVGLGLAPSSLLDYATPQSDIDEIKTLIREQN